MPRYILIDNHSGYIWADTADLDGAARDETPTQAAERTDRIVNRESGRYEEVDRLEGDDTGYHVYRADINGSEAIAVVQDGQDQETIDAVERDCEFITSIRRCGSLGCPQP